MIWVWFELDAVESDFSAFHRITEIERLTAEKFFKFCKHLAAYHGAVRLRVEQAQQEAKHESGMAFHEKRGRKVDRVYDDISKNPEAAQLFG